MVLLSIIGKFLQLKCNGCNEIFLKPNYSHIRKKIIHFHSVNCYNVYQRLSNLKRNKVCKNCNITFYDSSERPDSGTCCSKKCSYEKMSKTRHDKGSYSAKTLYSNCKGGYREDIGIYVRSNWEANFVRICNFLEKKWKYEPKIFSLNDGDTYTPDFEIEGFGFVEIKGQSENINAMRKYKKFIAENKDIKIKLITVKEYDILKKYFKNLITWEGK